MLQFYTPFQSNSKIVGGLPCPDTVGGLDPSETPVLESYFTFLFRLKLFFRRPKLQEPPRAQGGSHLLSLKCWWHSFSSGSCQFLLILQHLGVGGKWVSEGERMSGPSYSICWAPQHQGRHEHVHSTFPGGRQGTQRWQALGTQSTYGNLVFLRCSSENLAFGSCHRIIPWRRLKIISHEVHVVGYNHQFSLNVIF